MSYAHLTTNLFFFYISICRSVDVTVLSVTERRQTFFIIYILS